MSKLSGWLLGQLPQSRPHREPTAVLRPDAVVHTQSRGRFSSRLELQEAVSSTNSFVPVSPEMKRAILSFFIHLLLVLQENIK